MTSFFVVITVLEWEQCDENTGTHLKAHKIFSWKAARLHCWRYRLPAVPAHEHMIFYFQWWWWCQVTDEASGVLKACWHCRDPYKKRSNNRIKNNNKAFGLSVNTTTVWEHRKKARWHHWTKWRVWIPRGKQQNDKQGAVTHWKQCLSCMNWITVDESLLLQELYFCSGLKNMALIWSWIQHLWFEFLSFDDRFVISMSRGRIILRLY